MILLLWLMAIAGLTAAVIAVVSPSITVIIFMLIMLFGFGILYSKYEGSL